MRFAIGLLMLSMGLAMAFFGHALTTGVALPYPDPTPAQAAYERFHRPISFALFLAAVASFGAGLVSVVIAACLRFVGRLGRARPVDPDDPVGGAPHIGGIGRRR